MHTPLIFAIYYLYLMTPIFSINKVLYPVSRCGVKNHHRNKRSLFDYNYNRYLNNADNANDNIIVQRNNRYTNLRPPTSTNYRNPYMDQVRMSYRTPQRSANSRQGSGDLELHIYLCIVVDSSVTRFHGRNLNKYLLTQIAIVNKAFQHESLGVKVNIYLGDILTMDDNAMKKVNHPGKGLTTLRKFFKWNFEENNSKYDLSMYLTRVKMEVSGYGPIGDICLPTRNCVLVCDNGLTTAFVMNHEIAHALGLKHIGSTQGCRVNPDPSYIMNSMSTATHLNYRWSKCSRKAMLSVRSKLTCLHDIPLGRSIDLPQYPFGNRYDLDQQCQLEFGIVYSLCNSSEVSDPCTIMWCNSKRVGICYSKNSPALENTPCGNGKTCQAGKCQYGGPRALTHTLTRSTSNWTEWSQWSGCTRSCGNGVKSRTRRCRGNKCKGVAREHNTCIIQECAQMHENNRIFHCTEDYRSLYGEGDNYRCRMPCISRYSGAVLTTNHYVEDNSDCSLNSFEVKRCFKGYCQDVGCDGVRRSNRRFDRCGVCGGHGRSCNVIKGHFNKQIHPHKNYLVISLPKAARHINIEEVNPKESQRLLMKEAHSHYQLLQSRAYSRQLTAAGTTFTYITNGVKETIFSRGPITKQLDIMVKTSEEMQSTLYYSYTVQKRNVLAYESRRPRKLPKSRLIKLGSRSRRARNKYSWRYQKWSTCSRTCALGTKMRASFCINKKSKQRVDNRRCQRLSKRQPMQQFKECRMRKICPRRKSVGYRWKANSWSTCTKTCGVLQYRKRKVQCITKRRKGQSKVSVVDSSLCRRNRKKRQPKTSRKCKRIACPLDWTIGRWSKCSKSCGNGYKRRTVKCIKPKYKYYKCNKQRRPKRRESCNIFICINRSRYDRILSASSALRMRQYMNQ